MKAYLLCAAVLKRFELSNSRPDIKCLKINGLFSRLWASNAASSAPNLNSTSMYTLDVEVKVHRSNQAYLYCGAIELESGTKHCGSADPELWGRSIQTAGSFPAERENSARIRVASGASDSEQDEEQYQSLQTKYLMKYNFVD
jgi:hypothetical protein